MFTPQLSILPPAQLRLWKELDQVPGDFVLYGGTALALHLGHRQSVDFDHLPKRTRELLAKAAGDVDLDRLPVVEADLLAGEPAP